jgi:hypothetical protein
VKQEEETMNADCLTCKYEPEEWIECGEFYAGKCRYIRQDRSFRMITRAKESKKVEVKACTAWIKK